MTFEEMLNHLHDMANEKPIPPREDNEDNQGSG